MSIRDNVVAGLKLQGVRSGKALDEVAERSLRGANLWNEVKDRLDKPGGGFRADSSSGCASLARSRCSPTCC